MFENDFEQTTHTSVVWHSAKHPDRKLQAESTKSFISISCLGWNKGVRGVSVRTTLRIFWHYFGWKVAKYEIKRWVRASEPPRRLPRPSCQHRSLSVSSRWCCWTRNNLPSVEPSNMYTGYFLSLFGHLIRVHHFVGCTSMFFRDRVSVRQRFSHTVVKYAHPWGASKLSLCVQICRVASEFVMN